MKAGPFNGGGSFASGPTGDEAAGSPGDHGTLVEQGAPTGAGPAGRESLPRRRRSLLRRFGVLIAGTVVILVGVIISPLPGPGLSILGPIGLAILATEFEWARRMADQVRNGTAGFRAHTERLGGRVPRIWIVPVVVLYWLAVWAATVLVPIPDAVIWAASMTLFVPVAYVCYRIAVLRARLQAERRRARDGGGVMNDGAPPPGGGGGVALDATARSESPVPMGSAPASKD